MPKARPATMRAHFGQSISVQFEVTMGSHLRSRIEKAARKSGQSANHWARGVLLQGCLVVEQQGRERGEPDAADRRPDRPAPHG
jgi:hypothetical protein